MSYTRELVEQLLPAVWDSSYAFGMTVPLAPVDPELRSRRTTVDPAHGNTLYAYLADIRAAWRGQWLEFEVRRALLMYFGLGWREREIAAHEGVSRQTISYRITQGVGRLADFLNGRDADEAVE